MNRPEHQIFAEGAALQTAAAELIAARLHAAVAARGRAVVALAGGRTPMGIYGLLGQAPYAPTIPWPKITWLIGDERYVPAESPENNLSAIRMTLLDHCPTPAEQIFPVPTYFANPEQAAAVYHEVVAYQIGAHGGTLDLVLLGIGPDGHTASLFPDHPALESPPERFAVAVYDAPKPPPTRVSLTYHALSQFREAIFLVTGSDKAAAVAAIFAGDQRLPAARVRTREHVRWLLDSAAASELA